VLPVHWVAYVGREGAAGPPRVKIEQKASPFPLSNARRQLSAAQPGPYALGIEELTVAVLRVDEFFDEVVWELLEEWLVEELDDEELLDEFVKMEDVLDKILDERLDEELLLEERLLDRLEDKLDERLLDRLLERLLEMRLEQLIGHAVVIANGAGVIFGVTKDEVGYAHEQTEEI